MILATSRSRRRLGGVARDDAAIIVGAVGLVVIVAASALPWLFLFRGLASIPGFRLDGGPLLGIAIVVTALIGISVRRGGSSILRPLAALAAIAIVADSLLVAGRISAYVAQPGPAGLLSQPAAGIGAPLAALGGLVLLAAVIIAPATSRPLPAGLATRLVAAGILFGAGWVHAILVPTHLGESVVLGLGFLAAAAAQVVLAGLIVARPGPSVFTAVVAVNAALIAAYVFAVVVGLPFGDAGHGAAVAATGAWSRETVDGYGIVSKGAELVSAGLAIWLAGRSLPSVD